MSAPIVKTKSMIIGLTGGIASGKSTAADFLRSLDIPVIDSDQIVSKLWTENMDMNRQVVSHFGFTVKTKEDRRKLAKIIFDNPLEREALNHIVHPFVFEEIEKIKQTLKNEPILIIDMPLLYEVGYQTKVDYVLVVHVDQKTQIDRLILRDHLSYDEAFMRVQSQSSLDEKAKKADVVLGNQGTKDALYAQILQFLRGIGYEK